MSISEADSKYSKESVIRKSRFPYLNFDMISYNSDGDYQNIENTDLTLVEERRNKTKNYSEALGKVINLMNTRDFDSFGYKVLDTDNDGNIVWSSDEENNIEEKKRVKINNSWLPSTIDPAFDYTNEFDYTIPNVGGSKILCRSDPVGFGKWGKIYTEDKLPDPSPTLESNKGVYTGFQLFGRGFPEELKTNSSGDLIVSDGADNYDGFTKVKRPEGYLDFPLYYKLTSQISFSDILTSSDARCHAYPVFDVMKNKSNIYKTTLTEIY